MSDKTEEHKMDTVMINGVEYAPVKKGNRAVVMGRWK